MPIKVALYYGALVQHGGAERQWAAELRAFRKAGVDCAGIVHAARAETLAELKLSLDEVNVLRGGSRWQRVGSLRAWLKSERPSVLLSHSHQLPFLATRNLGVPYVLYQNSPPFYGDFDLNPFPLSWRHRSAYRALAAVTPGFKEFHRPPTSFGVRARLMLELRATLEAAALRHAAGVFVLSNRSAAEVRALYNVKSEVIRGCIVASPLSQSMHSVDLRAKHRLSPGPICLSVCRLEPVKRVELLIRAFVIVRESIPDASLIIVGTGSQASALQELAQSLGVVESVVFVGYVGDDDLEGYYAGSDLFLAPATADFNLAPYEAVERGLRSIVSDELEVEDWIVRSGWIQQVEPTASEFARTIVSTLAALTPASLDLTALSWDSRVLRILDFLKLPADKSAEGTLRS